MNATDPDRSAQAAARHLQTGHLAHGLGRRTARGGAITLGSQGAFLLLNTVAIAILARLLEPADFGLIAMAAVLTGIVNLVKEAGLSPATIQRREISQAEVSNLFWANVAVSVLLMLLMAVAASWIARFYEQPELRAVTLAFAATLLFSGLGVQHQALLRRQMRFTALAIIRVAALLLSSAGAILAAAAGWGYWSLVVMQAGLIVVSAAGFWIACSWRPSRPSRSTSIRSFLAFGGQYVGADVLNYLSRTLDKLLIGKFIGAEALGLYSRAYRLLLLPISQINAPLNTVAIPTLSRLQDDPARYRDYYLKGLSLVMFAGFPLVALTFVAAEDVIALLLGDQWGEAVLYFRALAPAALVGTVNVAGAWIFVSLGRVDRRMRAVLAHSILVLAAMGIGLRWGAIGVAFAYSIAMTLLRVPFVAYACHGSPVRLRDVGAAVWRPLVFSLLAGAAAALITARGWAPDGLLPRLLFVTGAYALLYLLLWSALPGGRGILAGFAAVARRGLGCGDRTPVG